MPPDFGHKYTMMLLDVSMRHKVIEPVTECLAENERDDGGEIEVGGRSERKSVTPNLNRRPDKDAGCHIDALESEMAKLLGYNSPHKRPTEEYHDWDDHWFDDDS